MGYLGDPRPGLNPSYHDIGENTETTQVEFDPEVTSYEKLLERFWSCHSPSRSRSRQYMSVIFPHSDEQERIAKASLATQKSSSKQEVATVIIRTNPTDMTLAEGYHQKFTLQNTTEVFSACGIKSPTELIDSPMAARLNGYLAGHGDYAELKKEITSFGLPVSVQKKVLRFVKRRQHGYRSDDDDEEAAEESEPKKDGGDLNVPASACARK